MLCTVELQYAMYTRNTALGGYCSCLDSHLKGKQLLSFDGKTNTEWSRKLLRVSVARSEKFDHVMR